MGHQLAVALSLLPRAFCLVGSESAKGKVVRGNGGLTEVRAETLVGRGGV